MTFKFTIRDDDTSYFTTPSQLEGSFGEVWGSCPVTLAVVPFHGCTKSGALPSEYWEGDQIFPVGDNQDLVKYLYEKIREGEVFIAMHGYSHKDQTNGFEFETGKDLDRKVAEGKRYLEQVFQVPIRVFVPPHNALSRAGFQAVISNGLSISGYIGPFKGSRSWRGIHNMVLRRLWPFIRGGQYMFPVHYPTHSEMGYFSLTPLVPLSRLMMALKQARRSGTYFCLTTHYWEFNAPQKTGEDMTMGQVFKAFWEKVSKLPDFNFVSLESMLG